jgi:hypothetical protein
MWEQFGDHTMHYRVNGCLEARITDREAREADDHFLFREMVTKRVAPLVWLAMPSHDAP